jgi:hypothetical protein
MLYIQSNVGWLPRLGKISAQREIHADVDLPMDWGVLKPGYIY